MNHQEEVDKFFFSKHLAEMATHQENGETHHATGSQQESGHEEPAVCLLVCCVVVEALCKRRQQYFDGQVSQRENDLH